jgi:hypothetical protein
LRRSVAPENIAHAKSDVWLTSTKMGSPQQTLEAKEDWMGFCWAREQHFDVEIVIALTEKEQIYNWSVVRTLL